MRCIRDPEHPYTLEQLNVVNMMDVHILGRFIQILSFSDTKIDKGIKKYVTIQWKPPFPTCSYATHIGLSILLRLERELMSMDQLKIILMVKAGTHKQKKISIIFFIDKILKKYYS